MEGQYTYEMAGRVVMGSVISGAILIVFSSVMKRMLVQLGDYGLAVFIGDMVLVVAPVLLCMLFFMGYGVYKLHFKKA